MYCKHCGAALPAQAPACPRCAAPVGAGSSFCAYCDAQLIPGAAFCSRCGQPAQPVPPPQQPFASPAPGSVPVSGQKSMLAAALLAFFLGVFGVHNFYLGYTGKGVAQLLIAILGGALTFGVATFAVLIWAIVEMVQLFTGAISVDGRGVPIARDI